jgi:type II secretory pathway pseudopilin PulG
VKRAASLLESTVAVALVTVVFACSAPVLAAALKAQRSRAAQAGDLKAVAHACDIVRREARVSQGVVLAHGQHRTTRSSLVLRRADGTHVVFLVERLGDQDWLVQRVLPPKGSPSRELIAPVDGLRVRLDTRDVPRASAVAFDLVFPRRTSGAPERLLSARSRVGER